MMFVLFLTCGAAYQVLTGSKQGYMAFQVRRKRAGATRGRSVRGRPPTALAPAPRTPTCAAPSARAPQALYFLSSYFNQFGPNCTTWLVAAEVFPTGAPVARTALRASRRARPLAYWPERRG